MPCNLLFTGLFQPYACTLQRFINWRFQLGAVVAGSSRRLSLSVSAVYDNSWTLVAGYVVLTALASAFAAKDCAGNRVTRIHRNARGLSPPLFLA